MLILDAYVTTSYGNVSHIMDCKVMFLIPWIANEVLTELAL